MERKQRRTPARMVEDTFQRVYDKHATRGLLVVGLGTLTVAILLVTVLLQLSFAGYADETVRTFIPYAGLCCAFTTVALVIGWATCWGHLRALLDWSTGPRNPTTAARAWATALEAPRVLVVRTTLVAFPLLLINLVVVYRGVDLPWSVYPVNAVGIALISASAGVASLLFMEFMLRPLTTDIARSLPPEFEPDPPRLALHTKAILPIPGVVVYTGLVVAGWTDTSAGFGSQIVQGISLSVAVSVVAVALYYVMAHAFLDPIDQLTEATRRVHAGDLASRVPLTSGDEFGVLAVSFNQMLDGLQEREHLRSHNAELSGQLEESFHEVRESRARIVAAADAERRRMERDLHDGAQQRLVMISLKLGMAGNLIESDPAAALALHEELSQDASRAIEELRDLAHGIYPPLLESDGLTSALEDIADQSPLPVAMECDGTDRYPAAVEAAVYFCCLEALQNTVKHAGADSRATIHLREDEGDLYFAVSDDGQGFDINGQTGSTGMQNMTDRIGALGGTVCVTSRPGAGTKVEGWVPVR